MFITIQSLLGVNLTLMCNSDNTVQQILLAIEKYEQIPFEIISISCIFGAMEHFPSHTLKDFNILKDTTLNMRLKYF